MRRRAEKFDTYQLRGAIEFAAEVGTHLLGDHGIPFDEVDTNFAVDLILKGWESSDLDEEARAVAARIAMMNRSAKEIVKDLEDRAEREADAELEARNAMEEEDTEEEQRAKDEES